MEGTELLKRGSFPCAVPPLTGLSPCSVEKELTAILRDAALHNGTSSGAAGSTSDGAGEGGGDATDADDCGSPDLDESLDSHFNYIQRVSAPQVGRGGFVSTGQGQIEDPPRRSYRGQPGQSPRV